MMDDYLNDLNEQQRAAVEYLGGPELVIAGAGSGKTRVLTYKIVHLLYHGYEPHRILALTFTNKAAREMRERITSLVDIKTASRLWMGTFHSIFSRILRQNSELLGYSKNYTIYDTTDSKSLIKMIVKDMGLDEKVYKISVVQNEISHAKNQLVSAEAYNSDNEIYRENLRVNRPALGQIYKGYVARMKVSDAMDFDDLLFNMAVLLRDNPGVLNHYREFFKYVLVDEFQDTNFAQSYITRMLTQGLGDICVVGDDAQSIYSFRGANIRNILELHKTYPDLKTFKLEQNYRSTQNIINAAGSLIEKNKHQIRKNVFSAGEHGEPVEVQSGYSDYDEAAQVASKIVVRRAQTGDPYSEFAILYRTNAQSRLIEEALRRRSLPYKIYGGLAFYQRKEVKDVLAYMRLTVNPDDEEALKRVINFPARGIGATTVGKISQKAILEGVSMWHIINNIDQYDLAINSGGKKKLADFAGLINEFIEMNKGEASAEDVTKHIITKVGLLSQYLSDRTPENISKVENIQELLRGVHEFIEDKMESGEGENATLADFLATVSLLTDQDEDDPAQANSVTLMTIHAAKGLEFSNVFVIGVEEDLLPSSLSADSPEEVEEERRLFYVAITRARKFCMLSYATSRFLNGQPKTCRPSRFLKDIDSSYLRYSYNTGHVSSGFEGGKSSYERISTPDKTFYNPVSTFKNRTSGRPNDNNSFGNDLNSRGRLGSLSPLSSRTNNMSNSGNLRTEGSHAASELHTGMRVAHKKFGIGTITNVLVNDIGDVVIVKFDNQPDEKKLLLKFAKFDIIS